VTFKGACSVTGGLTITGYNWNFGNSQTSTEQNPSAVTYATAGSYTATFNCTDSNGIASGEPATAIVNVTAPPSSGGGSKSGGGGALGLWALTALLLLAAANVRRKSIPT
jgi:PKD repeat protein